MPPAFQRVALIGKQAPEIAQPLRMLRDFLRQRGCEVMLERETAASVGESAGAADFDEIGRNADLAIVLGGDGTMLSAARNLAHRKVPLAGINQGRLGFMTDIALSEMDASVGAILEGRHAIEDRALIEAELLRGGRRLMNTVALNEAVVSKGSQARLIEFKLSINGEYVYALRADGVIVATPTGSTAYALSAQGPILQPTVPAFALVPLNPHVLSARPVSVTDSSVIEIELVRAVDARAHFAGFAL
ncbi:MAG: NAD kinase, partial [Betaproteobacteria bacterium]|nr:NAD kinase [Betaproteobacteria bacterium]